MVQPWTYSTNDSNCVYEPAESVNNVSVTKARSNIKTFWEPGTDKKI